MVNKSRSGFTIVELLVVIVVIGILAAITIVSFSNVRQKADVASMQSDLKNASTVLKMHDIVNNQYPTTVDCLQADSSTNKCLRFSEGTTIAYEVDNSSNPKTFTLTASRNGVGYKITENSLPVATKICPTGFIVVPGSSTYGTSEFCVMKYEAKNVGGIATSQASGFPWVNIPQTGAGSATTLATAACSGCHLITEAEWLTIAKNVLGVSSNWSGGAMGNGYIYGGHSDNVPGNSLEASATDSDYYANTGNSSSSGANQKRTLTLSNGSVIWDFSGNVYEWTSGASTTGQPGITGEAVYTWKNWTAITAPGTLTPNPSPAATGLAGASTWDSDKGIGRVFSKATESAPRGFTRGGAWGSDPIYAGVLSLQFAYSPTDFVSNVGFRVAAP